jgi:hypothetical protein
VNVRQERIRQGSATTAAVEAAVHGPVAEWKVVHGTLLTLGRRA